MKKILFCLIQSVSITGCVVALGYPYVNADLKDFVFHQESSSQVKQVLADKIKNISQLVTAEQRVTITIPVELNNKLKLTGQIIGKTTYVYQAVGTAIAGVNLKSLSADNISVDQKTIKIKLPPSSVFKTFLNPEESKILAYNKGWFAPDVTPQKQQEIEQLALEQIKAKALSQNLLSEADRNAQQALESLLKKTSKTKTTTVVSGA